MKEANEVSLLLGRVLRGLKKLSPSPSILEEILSSFPRRHLPPNAELSFAALAPAPFRSWTGFTNSVAPGTPCLLFCVLADLGVGRSLGFVDDLLEPISAVWWLVLDVNGGTFAFVGGTRAPGANRGPRGVLVAASMAGHDWPSRLLPRGFRVNIGLCATSRRAENSVRRGRGLCLDFSPTSLMSPLHSRRM